jgi:predicted transcriptional regulator of viral defense system
MSEDILRGNVSSEGGAQRRLLLAYLRQHGIARMSELVKTGVTAATVGRLVRQGAVERLGRGLYQLADAPLNANHSLAEAAKRVPKGVVCLTSALAFHGLTDQMPHRVWMAIGHRDWRPNLSHTPLRILRLAPHLLALGVETHPIENVPVRIFNVPKSVSDMFRNRRALGTEAAVQALKEALRQRKTTPAELADYAMRTGAWRTLKPYLEALTASG